MALEIKKNASLQSFNSMAVPATAKALVRVESLQELSAGVDYALSLIHI